MLARGVGDQIRRHGPSFPVAEAQSRLAAGDLVCGNLEAPLCTDGERRGAFQADPAAVEALGAFDVLTLANNHMLDCGDRGVEETIATLEAAGIHHVGVAETEEGALRPVIVRAGGATVAFIGCLSRALLRPQGRSRFRFAALESPALADVIRQTRERVDVLIALVHAGNEYVPYPAPSVRARLHELCAQGVDLVVTHHPHVLGGPERVGRSLIWHSLGDFVFDSEAQTRRRTGVLSVTAKGKGRLEFELEPMYLTDELQVAPAPRLIGEQVVARVERVARVLDSPRYAAEYPLRYVASMAGFQLERLQAIRRARGARGALLFALARSRFLLEYLYKLVRGRMM